MILNQVNIRADPGEFIALVGPSTIAEIAQAECIESVQW
jgi:ABC-type iron transport system FetAB ATPase subunit